MLVDVIASRLQNAMKSGNELERSVLRLLAAAIHNREIEKRTVPSGGVDQPLDDDEAAHIVRAELKKRRDAVAAYERAGRLEAALRERAEGEVLISFLPAELSDAEIEAIVAEGRAAFGAADDTAFGTLMGWVMGKVKGRASGERVSAIVKRQLEDR